MNLSSIPTADLRTELQYRGFKVEPCQHDKIVLRHNGRYKDGGTISYRGPLGALYYQDGRRNSKTRGEMFDLYPGDKDARQLNKSDFIFP